MRQKGRAGAENGDISAFMAGMTTSKAMRPAVTPVQPGPERTEYRVAGSRRTVAAFAVLLLLPFFASLPFMLFQRIAIDQWHDILPLAIVGGFFAVLMCLLLIQLMFTLRARVLLGPQAVSFTTPSGRGPTPKWGYASQTMPYTDIKSVVLRREVFGGAFAPVMLLGAHIVRKDGRDVALGYVSEINGDPAFPFPVIARQIAQRAGVPLNFDSYIWRTIWRKRQAQALGIARGQAHAMSADDIAAFNRSHRRFIVLLINLLVAAVVIGMATDYIGR